MSRRRGPDLYRKVRRAMREVRWPDGTVRYGKGTYGGDWSPRRAEIMAARRNVAGAKLMGSGR